MKSKLTTTKRRRKPIPTTPPDQRQARAAMLDRLADHQLQVGFHHQAERLAFLAAELRTIAR